MAFVALATNPADAAKTYIFYVLMNPDKLGKPGFRAQITWVSWFLESSEPSSMVLFLWKRTQKTQLKPGILFVLMNPARLGKAVSSTRLALVTCSLGSPQVSWVLEPS